MDRRLASQLAATSALLLCSCIVWMPSGLAQNGGNPQLQADVQKALNNGKLKGVTVNVQGDNVVLSGTVDTYSDKELADRKAHRVKGVKGVDDEIQVAGGNVSDQALRDKLAKQLATYTVGYGTTMFDALTVNVQNGVVTVGGSVYWPADKNAAIGIVSDTPGVKDVIDNIQVQPTSQMDDQLRRALARAIYGTPQLQKYAIDPQKPIRIIVENGKVTLAGSVDNQGDKDIAALKANGVPGVFHVTNDLQVASGGANK